MYKTGPEGEEITLAMVDANRVSVTRAFARLREAGAVDRRGEGPGC